MLEDLAWLGLTWDGPVVFQSERRAAYAAALDQLRERRLLYRCFRTRAEVAAAIGQAPHGPEIPFFSEPLSAKEEAARLAEGAPFAWRLSIAAAEKALGGFTDLAFVDAERGRIAADPRAAGDVVLARKDLGVAYHLAVAVDDAAQGVTLVVRGEDLLGACHIQRLLQALLGLPTPAYRHHRLVLGADGKRLAKRDKSQTLSALRAGGMTPQQLRAELGLKP
jgi:glutamyl-Q tRNA(Asp) synthetase